MATIHIIALTLFTGCLLTPPATAEFFRGTPMPNRPGCQETHCERLWDDELQRPFRRCFWRCPRPPPPPREYVPEPPQRYEAPPPHRQYQASSPSFSLPGIPLEAVLGIFAVIGLAILAAAIDHLNRITIARKTTGALDGAAAAQAALRNVEDAMAEADKIINAYRAESYRKGFDS